MTIKGEGEYNECWLTEHVIDCILKIACGASVRKCIAKIASSERVFFKLYIILVE